MGAETPADPRLALLLRMLDEGFDRKAWHGPNLRGSLRRLDTATLTFRPRPDRHNIWEIAVHAAYWKYAVRRRITGEDRGSFPLKGSNWFTRPDPAVHENDWETAWAADLKLLDETHRSLRVAVAAFDPVKLDDRLPGGKFAAYELILGVAMHDVYHAGQVRHLKRLAPETAGAKRKVKRRE
ncbi:MAG TPA: DinB family protein [Gemmataceae bacterium]|nr:DinB family protein [Gemmataceae bacterium]